jgi:mitochondrial inner membrane protease subunit 2
VLRQLVDWGLAWPTCALGLTGVCAFRSPYNPETTSIKRIIALEDELVVTRPPYPVPVVRVPPGHVWVEGDGLPEKSLDSNTYGPVSMQLITGKVTHILYPFRKFGRVRWEEFRRRRGEIPAEAPPDTVD